jgi:hypothetical protein
LLSWSWNPLAPVVGEHLEDVKEEVDDVEVELDGGHNVIIRAELIEDEPRVVDDEQAEEEEMA